MRLRALLFTSAAILVAFSCGGSKEEPDPKPQPQPQPQKQEINIPTESQAIFNNGIDFNSGSAGQGGSGQAQTSTVKFTATSNWSADVSDTKSSSWLSVQPSSGGAGDVNMTVTAQPNTGTEPRSGKVTLKCGNNTKSFTVNQAGTPPAVVPVESVALNKTTLALTKSQSETLVATVNPDNATDKTVTWSSSDATTASVTQNGYVTALKSGKVTITAKAGEKSATCEVTITTPVESVSLNKTTIDLEEGKTFTLIATINPSYADEKTVVWATSSTSIATVVNGVVTGVKEGEATITATVGGKTATCKVTVKSSGMSTDDPEGFEDGGEIEW